MVLSYYLGFHRYFSQLVNHLKDAINLLLEHIWLLSSLPVEPIGNPVNKCNQIKSKLIHKYFYPILKISNFLYISQYHLNYNFFMLVNINHSINFKTYDTLFYVNRINLHPYSFRINDTLVINCNLYGILFYWHYKILFRYNNLNLIIFWMVFHLS